MNLLHVSMILLMGGAPPLAGAFLGATSSAMGVTLTALFYLLFLKSYSAFNFYFKKRQIVALAVFFIYSSIQQIILGFFNIKHYLSVLLIFFLIYSSKEIGRWLCFNVTRVNLYKIVCYACISFIFIFIFNFFFQFQFASEIYEANRAVFPFGEPSHFALFTAPFFVLWGLMLKLQRSKFLLLLFIFCMAFAVESLTFVIYLLFFILIVFARKSSVMAIIFAGGFMFAILFILVNNIYFIDRLFISSETNNLSSLVYLQGLQDAWNSLFLSYGLGLGFQMLGTQPPSEASVLIASILDIQPEFALNRFDGGFLSAKIVAEFGVLGLLCLIFYVYNLIKSYVFIYTKVNFKTDAYQVGFNVFFVCSAVEFFVRGIGYFSPSLFILLILYFASMFSHNRNNCPNGS